MRTLKVRQIDCDTRHFRSGSIDFGSKVVWENAPGGPIAIVSYPFLYSPG